MLVPLCLQQAFQEHNPRAPRGKLTVGIWTSCFPAEGSAQDVKLGHLTPGLHLYIGRSFGPCDPLTRGVAKRQSLNAGCHLTGPGLSGLEGALVIY